jgi:hypothetical protein
MLSTVADELVATMGGYGYVEQYPAERYYRDARINRIFEGTNEINRLIITGWLMKRALKGQLPLLAAIKKLMDEVMQPPVVRFRQRDGRAAGAGGGVLAAAKKLALFAAGVASQRFMTGARRAAGSDGRPGRHDHAGVRAGVGAAAGAQAGGGGKGSAEGCGGHDGLLAEETMALAEQAARRVLAACAEGDMLRTQLAILRRLAKYTPADTVG